MAGRSAEAGAFIDLLFVVHRILPDVLVNHVGSASLDCTRKGAASWHADRSWSHLRFRIQT